jgi:hypothetical protein
VGIFFRGTKRPNTSESVSRAYSEGRLKHKRGPTGEYRNDLGIYVRSRWEANYLRVLNYLEKLWIYEPETFTMEIDDRKITYTPDIFLPEENRYIEIKGYWYPGSKEKFQKFSENNNIELVDKEKYQKLFYEYKDKIILWEVAKNHEY